jgi:HAD superfamily hydrolase (TIGR01549 family)
LEFKRYFLTACGYGEQSEFTEERVREALVEPRKWLGKLMKEKKPPSHWEPSVDEWKEFDRLFLRGLGLDDNPDRMSEAQLNEWEQALDALGVHLIENCKDVLEKLRARNYQLGVASNRFGDPRPELEKSSILDLFGAIEWTHVPGYRKPSPYMLLKVAEQLGVNPLKCAYVGNSIRADVEAAHRAGMKPIFIPTCNLKRSRFVPEGLITITEMLDLLDLLV